MARVRVKVCGVTTAADAVQAARLGADALGLNFYPGSPRCLSPAGAAAILDVLPPFVEAVGLFVEVPLAEIAGRLADLGRIVTVQWHGQHAVPVGCPPYRLIPAFPVRAAADLERIRRHVEASAAQGHPLAAVLVDAHVPGQHGGTGQTAPWHLLEGFDPGVPLILAGGLTPDNVAEAVRRIRPYAVDVASGVESAPGRKDADKVRRFMAAVREASDRL